MTEQRVENSGRWWQVIGRLLVIFLVQAVIAVVACWAWSDFGSNEEQGIDYLHFWVVPQYLDNVNEVAPSDRGVRLHNPCTPHDTPLYNQAGREALSEVIPGDTISYRNKLLNCILSIRFYNLAARNQELYPDGVAPTGTPFLYATFGAISTNKFEQDFWLYQSLSNLLCVLGICLLGRIAGVNWVSCFLLVALTFFLCRPLSLDFSVANTNRFQLGVLGICFWFATRSRFRFGWAVAAILLGLLTAFKPNVLMVPGLLFVALWVDGYKERAAVFALTTTLGLGAGVVIGNRFFGDPFCWFFWRDYLQETMRNPFPMSDGNYTWLAAMGPGWISIVSVSIALLAAAFIAASAWRGRSSADDSTDRSERRVLIASFGLLVPLLSSPVAWSHYFLLALPTIILAMRFLRFEQPQTAADKYALIAWSVGALLVFAIPISMLGITSPQVIATLLAVGVLALLGCGLWLAGQRQEMPGEVTAE